MFRSTRSKSVLVDEAPGPAVASPRIRSPRSRLPQPPTTAASAQRLSLSSSPAASRQQARPRLLLEEGAPSPARNDYEGDDDESCDDGADEEAARHAEDAAEEDMGSATDALESVLPGYKDIVTKYGLIGIVYDYKPVFDTILRCLLLK